MTDLLPLLVALPVVAGVVPPVLARRVRDAGRPVAAVALAGQTLLVARVTWTVADELAVVFLVLVTLAGVSGLSYGGRTGPRSATGYALYCFLLAGLTGLCVTRDAFTLYVFLEIAGLAAYGLVALGDGRRAAPAALRYLLVGTAGATLYLLGVGYLYLATGALRMADVAARLPRVGYDDRLVLAGFALVTVGLGVKVALFPVHTWKPAAYRAAPPGVTAVLAALVSTVAAYAYARLLLSVFTLGFLDAVPVVGATLRTAAVLSIVAGAVLAAREPDVRRMLAFSSVSQFGVVLAGLSLATPAGVAGAVVHLVGHAVMKSGAFAAAGAVETATGATTVDDYAGVADRVPVAGAALATLSFGLVGLPPLVGFFGKWYVALAAVGAGAPVVAAAVLLSTALSLVYFGRLVGRLVPGTGASTPAQSGDARGLTAGAVLGVVAALGLGLASAHLVAFLDPALAGVGG